MLIAVYSGLLYRPLEWQYWAIASVVVVIGSVLIMTPHHATHMERWLMVWPVCVLIAGSTGVLFFVTAPLVEWAIISGTVVLNGLFLEDLFTYYYQPLKYANVSLPNLSFFLLTIGTWGLMSMGFALELISVADHWMVTLGALAFTATNMVHTLRSYKVWKPENIMSVAAVTLVVTELVWMLQYWPTTFYVNGLVVALVVYCIPALIQLQLRNALQRDAVLRYVGIATAALILTLSTAQWT